MLELIPLIAGGVLAAGMRVGSGLRTFAISAGIQN